MSRKEKNRKFRKRKIRKPASKQKWNKQIGFYYNKGAGHYFLSVKNRNDSYKGHSMTTHPSLDASGKPKSKFYMLKKNPNPKDKRDSYINTKIRIVKGHYEDSGSRRLKKQKGWKLPKEDKKVITKIDRKK